MGAWVAGVPAMACSLSRRCADNRTTTPQGYASLPFIVYPSPVYCTGDEMPPTAPTSRTYRVDGMSCEHCVVAVTAEVTQVDGVDAVDVDLETKLVSVQGGAINDDAVVAAIDEAGYDAVAA